MPVVRILWEDDDRVRFSAARHIMVITLIGMSGAGKSSVAAHLADLAQGTVIDIDKLIEAAEKKSLQDILEQDGEEAFLEREARAVRDLQIAEGNIISPGGSIVLSPEAMNTLKKKSMIIYLHTPFESIERRIGEGGGRGIVGLGRKTLREIYDERLPLYEHYADITLDTTLGSAKKIATHAWSRIQSGSNPT